MRIAFFKNKKLAVFLLVILVAIMVYCASVIWLNRIKSPTGYYIDPPRNYFYLKDRKQNKVVQWLQRIPRKTHPMGERYESPCTFEDWLGKGQDIDDLEDTLLFLYTSRFKGLLRDGLSEALKRYGTHKSIDFFSARLERHNWTNEYKNEMYDILYGIINDEAEFWQLIKEIDQKKEQRLSDPNASFF